MKIEELREIYRTGDRDFQNVSLQKMRFYGIFNGINLTNANLAESIFTESSLIRANLTGANLTGADLTESNLTGANLTGANLTGADLTESNLTGANLTGAEFLKAMLVETDLRDSIFLNAQNLHRVDVYNAFCMNTVWDDGSIKVDPIYLE